MNEFDPYNRKEYLDKLMIHNSINIKDPLHKKTQEMFFQHDTERQYFYIPRPPENENSLIKRLDELDKKIEEHNERMKRTWQPIDIESHIYKPMIKTSSNNEKKRRRRKRFNKRVY